MLTKSPRFSGAVGKRIARDAFETLEETIKALHAAVGFLQALVAVIEGPPIVRGQEEETQRLWLVALEHVLHHDLVALAL